MHFTTGLIATLAATITSAAALGPIVPPKNPASNGQQSYCNGRTECLTIINNVRADQEGLDPITLPSNWNTLTRPERLFTFMNLERVSRGLNPLLNLVNTYTSEVETAITNDADPEPPASINSSWQSIWAGGDDMIALSAMYLWMYYDGPGGSNLDCTSSSDSGCWGHRDAILDADVNAIDAGAGTDSRGSAGFAAILFVANEAPSAAEVVLTWASEKTKLTS
jgi:hypothetical protein